jgi:hypothetical protein
VLTRPPGIIGVAWNRARESSPASSPRAVTEVTVIESRRPPLLGSPSPYLAAVFAHLAQPITASLVHEARLPKS